MKFHEPRHAVDETRGNEPALAVGDEGLELVLEDPPLAVVLGRADLRHAEVGDLPAGDVPVQDVADEGHWGAPSVMVMGIAR